VIGFQENDTECHGVTNWFKSLNLVGNSVLLWQDARMFGLDQKETGIILTTLSFLIVASLFSFGYMSKKDRTDEESLLLAAHLNHLSAFITLVSVGAAGGVSFGGGKPLVITFALGTPIAMILLYMSHLIQTNVLRKNIEEKR